MRSLAALILIAVLALAGVRCLHADPKGPRTFKPTDQDAYLVAAFEARFNDVRKEFDRVVVAPARVRFGLPADAPLQWDRRAGWVLPGDVAEVSSK